MSGVTRHADPQFAGEDVVAWRVARLRSAGFDRGLAEQLARDRRSDLHALLELVDRGCIPELAARILAPFDDDEGSRC